MSRRARSRGDKRAQALALASTKPRRYCDSCGLGEAEHMACEEPDCGQLVEAGAPADHITTSTGDRINLRTPWVLPSN